MFENVSKQKEKIFTAEVENGVEESKGRDNFLKLL